MDLPKYQQSHHYEFKCYGPLVSFRNLYETEDYDKVYVKSLDLLETEWRQSLR
jgi:hypothetical protein